MKRRRWLGSTAVVAAVSVLVLAGCGGSERTAVRIEPAEGLLDVPLRLEVGGAEGGAPVRLTLSATGEDGVRWIGSREVRPDGTGSVSIDGGPPLASLRPTGPRAAARDVGLVPDGEELEVRLQATQGDRSLGTARATRRMVGSDVARARAHRCPRRAGRAPVDRPERGSTARGGPLARRERGGFGSNHVERLLASHGYPVLQLAYFGEAGLPGSSARSRSSTSGAPSSGSAPMPQPSGSSSSGTRVAASSPDPRLAVPRAGRRRRGLRAELGRQPVARLRPGLDAGWTAARRRHVRGVRQHRPRERERDHPRRTDRRAAAHRGGDRRRRLARGELRGGDRGPARRAPPAGCDPGRHARRGTRRRRRDPVPSERARPRRHARVEEGGRARAHRELAATAEAARERLEPDHGIPPGGKLRGRSWPSRSARPRRLAATSGGRSTRSTRRACRRARTAARRSRHTASARRARRTGGARSGPCGRPPRSASPAHGGQGRDRRARRRSRPGRGRRRRPSGCIRGARARPLRSSRARHGRTSSSLRAPTR